MYTCNAISNIKTIAPIIIIATCTDIAKILSPNKGQPNHNLSVVLQ